jgi:hypothetical protein
MNRDRVHLWLRERWDEFLTDEDPWTFLRNRWRAADTRTRIEWVVFGAYLLLLVAASFIQSGLG